MNILDTIKQNISAVSNLPNAIAGAEASNSVVENKGFTPANPHWEYYNKIKNYLKNDYGSPYADKIASETLWLIDKYPLYQKLPYLIPAITVNETSAGKNMEGNRIGNWGIKEPTYTPTSIEHELERMGTGIAERTPAYEEFRNTFNIEDLAKRYAPVSDNNSPNYGKNILDTMERMEKYGN